LVTFLTVSRRQVTAHEASAEFVDKLKADGKDASFKSFEGELILLIALP
jgi:hypothetical protein